MWPWETEPRSIAHGILDDETYDWAAVVEGMLRSGGSPIVVDDDELHAANRLARDTTRVEVSHTGSAGRRRARAACCRADPTSRGASSTS
jgi:threonine synthase